jgi:serine/threonine protein kinase
MAVAAGTRLGPYQILNRLGIGGMGEVYRAHDPRLQRDVAIKVLPDHLAQDTDAMKRFQKEARAVASLSHPNIVAIHDFGADGGVSFVVTELLEGETLRAKMQSGGLSWRNAVEIASAVADGLAAAHSKGVIHRDIKPENLFITSDGRVKILDFGLAGVKPAVTAGESSIPTATDPGTVMGTVGYMSPEQVRGVVVDAPSDIFSLGCVLYEMCAARRPFEKETAADSLAAILKKIRPYWREFPSGWNGSFSDVWRRTQENASNRRMTWPLP